MNESSYVCPYLDYRDARCADLLTMMNINGAFRLCVGDYESCNIYHQIRLAEILHEKELAILSGA